MQKDRRLLPSANGMVCRVRLSPSVSKLRDMKSYFRPLSALFEPPQAR
jgi:hypothetical protein